MIPFPLLHSDLHERPAQGDKPTKTVKHRKQTDRRKGVKSAESEVNQ